MVTFLVLRGADAVPRGRAVDQSAAAAATATEMQMLSQRLARGSALAVAGAAGGIRRRQGQPRAVQGRHRGAAQRRNDPRRVASTRRRTQATPSKLLNAVKARWERVDARGRAAARERDQPDLAGEGLEAINARQHGAARAGAAGRGSRSGRAGGSLRELDYANQLAVLSQRIAKNANTLASSDEIDPEVAFLLGKDTGTFRDVLNGLLEGQRSAAPRRRCSDEDARATLAELQKRFTAYEAGVNAILQNMQRLTVAKQAARRSTSKPIRCSARRRSSRATTKARARCARFIADRRRSSSRCWRSGCLVLLGKVFLDDARVRAFESEGENKRNQEAILRLLNEMGNLADGDLTVQASVTEDVTGAIADSINFTIEELRTLVRGINSATDQVTKATQETQAISNRLFEASQRQNKEIQQASASVLQMAQSINEVAQNATQSARVAQQALGGRRKGRQRGAEPDRGHERNPHADPGHVEAHQAPRRVVARDRRDRRADLGHHRADERARAQRRDPGGLGRRSRAAGSRWWPRKCSGWPSARARRRSRSRRS